MATRQGLGDVLIEERLIAREQLNQAKRAAERLGSPLVAVLLEQGLVTEEALVESLRRRLQIEIFDPVHTVVDLDAVREVPFEEANRYRLLPVQLQQPPGGQRMLRVAMVDPLDAQAIEDIEFSTGCMVEAIIARPSHLADAIRHHYRGVVTKVIMRARADEPAPSRGGRRPFAGDLEEGELHTKPVHRVQQSAAATQRVDALVSLLVRKELITQDEYEEQLRVFLRPPEEES